jgi:GNAT superfamily N-acetyltransferase
MSRRPSQSVVTISPISSWRDALRVRRVRNSCREWLADSRHIGWLAQIRWYFRYNRDGSYMLFVARVGSDVIGYGSLQFAGIECAVTECVLPRWRGQGIGTQVLKHLTYEATSRGLIPVAEIRADNHVSIMLHQTKGFVLSPDRSGNGTLMYRYSCSSTDSTG